MIRVIAWGSKVSRYQMAPSIDEILNIQPIPLMSDVGSAAGSKKYQPHGGRPDQHGARECARRVRQMAKAAARRAVLS